MNTQNNNNEASGFEAEQANQSIESSKPPRLPILVGGRDALMKAITNNVKLIEQIGESPFLTARQVLDVLKSQKLLSPVATAKIKSANGVGDALGHKHLDLPFIIEGGKRAYLIQAAAWTVEEKEEFDEKTTDEKLVFMESLFIEGEALIQAARAVEDKDGFDEALAFDEGLSTEAVALTQVVAWTAEEQEEYEEETADEKLAFDEDLSTEAVALTQVVAWTAEEQAEVEEALASIKSLYTEAVA